MLICNGENHYPLKKLNVVYKIAITGPESTGKTQLAEQLAKYYNTMWVPEFAREYIHSIHRPYEFDDIEIIAKQQVNLEGLSIKNATNFLFCDTDILVTKVWSDFVFGKCSKWIEEQFLQHKYDFYLLCDIDLEWEYDPQREHPHKRKELFEIYKNHLIKNKFPFAIVSGIGNNRLQSAIKSMDKQLELKHEKTEL